MSNYISNQKNPESVDIKMSNGLTDVMISVLCLAGADIAESQWEKELMVWLSSHDQSISGSGMVSFDLDQLGWSKQCFFGQQQFVFQLLNRAKDRVGWDKLDLEPNVEMVEERLDQLRQLVRQYSSDYVEEKIERELRDGNEATFTYCTQHGIYLHSAGCIICNNR